MKKSTEKSQITEKSQKSQKSQTGTTQTSQKGQVAKRKLYRLIPKNGHGCEWYTRDIYEKPWVKAFSKDGFETIVEIGNYRIEKMYDPEMEEEEKKRKASQKGQGERKKTYRLIPKNGHGCEWYTHNIHEKPFVKAFSKDGFETIVEIEKYRIYEW